MGRLESSRVEAGSAVNDNDVSGSALAGNGSAVSLGGNTLSAGLALASTDSGSAVKKPLICLMCDSPNVGKVEKGVYECWECGAGWKTSEYREPYSKPLESGSALNEPSPAEFGPTPKRKLCNADIGRNNVSKRALYGATCIVRSALFNAQYDVTAFSDEQIKLMVEAEAAMTRLVDSWQKLPGSWQNREKNGWSRKSTSLVPTRVKHG